MAKYNSSNVAMNCESFCDCYELMGRIDPDFWSMELTPDGTIDLVLNNENENHDHLELSFQGGGVVRIRIIHPNGEIKSTRTYDSRWSWLTRNGFEEEIKKYGEQDGFNVPDCNYVNIKINDERRDVDSLIDKIHEFNENA